MIKKLCMTLAAGSALITGSANAAIADYFLKIAGITGSSTVVGFEGRSRSNHGRWG
jgi:hypothetical protein